MEELPFRYVSTAHSVPGGQVGFILERPDGGQFIAILTVADAQRLLDDLRVQVDIASQKSN